MVLENGFFGTVFNFLINVFMWFISFIGNLIFTPVETILRSLIPNFNEFLFIVRNFFVNVTQFIGFVKEFLFDYLQINRELFSAICLFFIAKVLIIPAFRSIILMYNVWKLKQGTN